MTWTNRDRDIAVALILKRQTTHRLEEFRHYTYEIESKFDNDRVLLSRRSRTRIEALSPEQLQLVHDYFADDYYTIEEIYIGQYRKSTVVSLYSFLEHTMNRLCRHVQKRSELPLNLDEIRGEGIVRAKTYLDKVAGVDFVALNAEWSRLMTLNKVRNCIVHCEGDVTAAQSASLLRLVCATPGLSLRSERFITVDRSYLDDSASAIEDFLEKLYDQVM